MEYVFLNLLLKAWLNLEHMGKKPKTTLLNYESFNTTVHTQKVNVCGKEIEKMGDKGE